MQGTIHEMLNDKLVTIQEAGKDGTSKVIRQEDLGIISGQLAFAISEGDNHKGNCTKTSTSKTSWTINGIGMVMMIVLWLLAVLLGIKELIWG